MQNMLNKDTLSALGGVDFTKVSTVNHYSICALDEN